jgi:hypothetical protein
MILLSRLPPAWETSIIQTVMSGGQVTGITWALTTQTIIRYWDADQAKRVGHRPTAHKLSAVKKFQGPPSFRGPQPQQQDGSGKGKKKKRGSAGKGKKKKFGAVHFASAPSGPAPVAHTIAHIGPQGLYQRLEVSDPVTSSFGQGPWTTFNNAMQMADSLQVPKTQRTVQRLEQSLLQRIERAPTPESTSSAEETIQRPPTPLEYMDLKPPSVAPTPERQMMPPPTPRRSPAPPIAGNGGRPFRSFMAVGTNLTAEQAWQRSEQPQLPIEDRVDWDDGSLFGDGGYDDAEPGSASGIYDLVDFDDWYVYSDSSLSRTNGITKTVCASRRSQIVSKEDSVLLSNYLSTCSGSHCTICKGSGSNLRNPEWMLDSGASAHFTPVFSDFIAFTRFKEPLKVNTASTPIIQFGFGTVLLSYPLLNSKKGIEETKTLRIRDVLFVPHITQRILSLGEFLEQGMHVYGDVYMMTLVLPKSMTPVFQCSPMFMGEKLFWLRASSITPTSLNLVVVEDYELMHRHLGHPSKEVMRRALQNTRGFPEVDFPRRELICPGCAQGKMP